MCDLLRSNLEEYFPQIEKSIEDADFVAIDFEFTGLSLPGQGPSLFDSGADRYAKIRQAVKAFTPTQIGISAFVRDKNSRYFAKYEAHTYNFFIYPLSFGPIDVQFTCQASGLEFLSRQDFDFNKFVSEGVSVLNNEQEETLLKHLHEEALLSGLIRDVDELSLQAVCAQVSLGLSKNDSSFSLLIPPELSEYVVIVELRQRFSNIWITAEHGKIFVQKVTSEEREKFELESKQTAEEKIMNKMLGFTRVFRTLVKNKKPLIGHNCFMDLLFLYEKCFEPLPVSYMKYKDNIHQLFPTIYDTKNISSSLRQRFDNERYFLSTNLSDLFKNLTSDESLNLTMYNPEVTHHPLSQRYEKEFRCHEAGFDAFMTGVVFLHSAHIVSYEANKHVVSWSRALSFHQYLVAVKEFVNEINLIRASVNCIRLDRGDAPASRPQWLHIAFLKSPMQPTKLACLLSSHGDVDVQSNGRWSALVAVPNFKCGKAILKSFRKDERVKISRYSLWKHHPAVKGSLIIGLIASSSLCVWTVYSSLK